MNQVEQVDLMQTQILGLKELDQMVAVIDTCASRGTFKAEEFSTIGRLREIIIARVKHKHKSDNKFTTRTN